MDLPGAVGVTDNRRPQSALGRSRLQCGWVRVPQNALDEMEEIAFGPSQMEIYDLTCRGLVHGQSGADGREVQVVGVRNSALDLTTVADVPAAGPIDPANPRRSLHEDPFYIGGFFGAGLTATARSRVPRTVATSEDEEMKRSCTVCQDPCKAGEEISKLPCNEMHCFHTRPPSQEVHPAVAGVFKDMPRLS